MADGWSHWELPGDLSEKETLARLTVEEKAAIAEPAIADFPHLDQGMLGQWIASYCDGGGEVNPHADPSGAVEVLVGCLEGAVESGREPEALDHFVYGQVYEANIARLTDASPDEVADREPLETWDGVYEGVG